MVAMACETRYCRGGTATGSVDDVGARRRARCRRSPVSGPARFYLVGRYYDPATGQFLSVDAKVQQTLEAYLYAGDDPVNRIDPSGMFNVGAPGEANSPDVRCRVSCSGGFGVLLVLVRGAKAAGHATSDFVRSNAGIIATAASLAALAIPGIDFIDLGVIGGISVSGALTLTANVVADSVGGIRAYQDFKQGRDLSGALDVLGSVAGVGALHLQGIANLERLNSISARTEVVQSMVLDFANGLANAARVASVTGFTSAAITTLVTVRH